MPRQTATRCANCGEPFDESSRILRTQDGVDLCESCYEETTYTCGECGERFSSGYEMYSMDDDHICQSCAGSRSYYVCDRCGNHSRSPYLPHRWEDNGHSHSQIICCNCGDSIAHERLNGGEWWAHSCGGQESRIHSSAPTCSRCGRPNPLHTTPVSGYTRPCGYHHHHAGYTRPDTEELCIGFEFEVCGTDVSRQWRCLAEQGITPQQIHPESDASVDVEWVTQPIPKSQVWDFVRKVCRGLRNGGATAYDAPKSCGAHHNIDRDYLPDTKWDTAVRAVDKYYELLSSFSGPQRRFSYCRSSSSISEALGKRGAVHFPTRRPAVEFRLPGMTLAPNMMATQVTLYINLVESIKSGKTHTSPFQELFGPFSEEMIKCITRKGFDYTTGMPSRVKKKKAKKEKGYARKWGEFRIGDRVRPMSLVEIAEWHQLPVDSFIMSIPYELGRSIRSTPDITTKLRMGLVESVEKALYPSTNGVPSDTVFEVVDSWTISQSLLEGYSGVMGCGSTENRIGYVSHTVRLKNTVTGELLPLAIPCSILTPVPDPDGNTMTMDPRIPASQLAEAPTSELMDSGRVLMDTPPQRPDSDTVERKKLSEDNLDEDMSKWDSSSEDNSTPARTV